MIRIDDEFSRMKLLACLNNKCDILYTSCPSLHINRARARAPDKCKRQIRQIVSGKVASRRRVARVSKSSPAESDVSLPSLAVTYDGICKLVVKATSENPRDKRASFEDLRAISFAFARMREGSV